MQLGFTANSGWEAALIVRNLFDETGYNYISGSNYGELIGWDDPRYRYVRSLQRPRTHQPVVLQEVVTASTATG